MDPATTSRYVVPPLPERRPLGERILAAWSRIAVAALAGGLLAAWVAAVRLHAG